MKVFWLQYMDEKKPRFVTAEQVADYLQTSYR